MLYPFEMEVEVVLQSDLHISGVGRSVALIDRCIERDVQGRPLIPSTSFKGRTRAHYERLLAALGYDLRGCQPPNPATMCNDPNDLCPACALFGAPVQQGRVEFTDLAPAEAAEPTTRIGVGVNRKLNTVAEGRLFFYEAAPQQLNRDTDTTRGKSDQYHENPCTDQQLDRYAGTIRGWATEQEIACLIAALKLITHFGGQKARGLGRATVCVQTLHLRKDGAWQPVPPDDMLTMLQEAQP